jgi:hypothetical protein
MYESQIIKRNYSEQSSDDGSDDIEQIKFTIRCKGKKCKVNEEMELITKDNWNVPIKDSISGWETTFYPVQAFGSFDSSIKGFRTFAKKLQKKGWIILLPEQSSSTRTKAWCPECKGETWWKK